MATEAGDQVALPWMRASSARVEAGERCWRRWGVCQKDSTGRSKQNGELIYYGRP
jgi:hypothetical protein